MLFLNKRVQAYSKTQGKKYQEESTSFSLAGVSGSLGLMKRSPVGSVKTASVLFHPSTFYSHKL